MGAKVSSDGYSLPNQVERHAKNQKAGVYAKFEKEYSGQFLEGKRVLVTGGNRGLGLAIVKELVANKAVVFATTRKECQELSDMGVQVISGVDVTNLDWQENLVESLDEPLDILINNAGYFWEPEETLKNINFEEQLKMIDICALGPLRISSALYNGEKLKKGSVVAFITSQGGSITWRDVQNPEGHDYGHHMSKAAANMGGKLLSQELKKDGIPVVILHPGFNRTDMTKKYSEIWDIEGAVDSSVGAKRVVHAIKMSDMTMTGKFINCEDFLQIPW